MYVCNIDAGDAIVGLLSYKVLCVVASVVFVTYFSLRYSIYYWILSYTVLAAAAVYLLMTDLEGNCGGNVGG